MGVPFSNNVYNNRFEISDHFIKLMLIPTFTNKYNNPI
jgi:hypothetical protein